MSEEDKIARGIIRSKEMEHGGSVTFFEIIFLSTIIGVNTRSWFWFGISLVCFFLCLTVFKTLAVILVSCISLVWGVLAGIVAKYFFGSGAGFLIGTIVFFVCLGIRLSGLVFREEESL